MEAVAWVQAARASLALRLARTRRAAQGRGRWGEVSGTSGTGREVSGPETQERGRGVVTVQEEMLAGEAQRVDSGGGGGAGRKGGRHREVELVFLSHDDRLSGGSEEEEEEDTGEVVVGVGMPPDLLSRLEQLRAARGGGGWSRSGGEDGGEDEEREEPGEHREIEHEFEGTCAELGEGEGAVGDAASREVGGRKRWGCGGFGGVGSGYVHELEGVLRNRASVPRQACYVPQ